MRLNLRRPLFLFDVESTGTDVTKDYIVELAYIKIYPDGTREKKCRRIKPPIPIPESASKVHGITDADVANEPTFPEIAKALFAIVEGCDIGGFINLHFDVPLLYKEFLCSGIVWSLQDVNIVDAGNIFKRKEERTLAAAVKFYLNKEHEDAHSAMADIEATEEVLVAQLEKYNDLPEEMDKLALFCNFDKPRLDVGGKFVMDEYGNIVINFGKNKGKLAKDEQGFLYWMLDPERNFFPDAKAICNDILREFNPKYNDLQYQNGAAGTK